MNKIEAQYVCRFTDAVFCVGHNKCFKCGWNPVVAKARVNKWKEECNIEDINIKIEDN